MKHLLALSTGRILALLTTLLLTACSIVPTIVTGTLTSAATNAAISLLPEGKPEYASIGISEPYFTQLTTDDKGKHYLTYRVDYETSIKDKIQLPVVTYILDRDGKPILNDEGQRYLCRVDYMKVSKKEPSGFFEPQIPFEWIPRGHSDLRLSYFVLDPYIKDSVLIRSGIIVSVGQIIQRELTENGKEQPAELMAELFGTDDTEGILNIKDNVCTRCHGDGHCPVCKGNVKITCLACDNSGYCSLCGGLGFILDK